MCITRSVVRQFYQLCITPSVVCYLVTCVTFLSVACCKLQLKVVHNLVSCAFFCLGCMITLSVCITRSVVYFPISCALLGQLCTSLSVVHYSNSCVLPSQLSQTRSVVLHSVSWTIIPSVVYYSVGCVLFHHLCITPSGEFNPLFIISIFETLANFTQLQVTQLIEAVKQKIFSNLGILSPELLKCFIFPLFVYSLTISSVLVFNVAH